MRNLGWGDRRVIDYRTPSPAQIAAARQDTFAAAEQIVAEVVAIPAGRCTYANTLQRLEDLEDLLHEAYGRYGFFSQVAVEREVREAALALREASDKFGNELSFREDLYEAISSYAATEDAATLSGERRRFLERVLRDYRRNGFGLPAETRERVKALRARLVEVSLAYRKNIDDWDDAILVTREDLAGLPRSYIEGLKTEQREGHTLYRVSLDYPEFFPFMDAAESEDLRRELQHKAYCKGGAENVALLEEAIALRDGIARLLGYESWAAYVLEVRMAATPEAAHGFLDDLRTRAAPLLERDLRELSEEKARHTRRPDARAELWDWRFYHRRIRMARYAVDEFEVARYFPLDAVLEGLFFVYQTLLGVRFEPVEPANAWHPDVRLYRIVDAADAGSRGRSPRPEGVPTSGVQPSGFPKRGQGGTRAEPRPEGVGEPNGFPNSKREIAHFYMDLFPREHKYGHAAAFSLRAGRRLADGRYQRPVSAIVCNFTRPTEDQPSLLRHSEVETLFHEFGHILHQTLTSAECHRFSGSKTERDFVEAPSQMLEHWVWLTEILRCFSRHVETGKPLPDELLERMIAARHLHAGVLLARQLFFANLDLACHGPGERKDTNALVRALHPISGFDAPEGTHFQSGFGHLFGYDAGYYGYLWSEVYADDMFTRFQAAGPLNEQLGLEYRRTVLERGGSVDGAELVRDFLRREPNNAAFLTNRGLS